MILIMCRNYTLAWCQTHPPLDIMAVKLQMMILSVILSRKLVSLDHILIASVSRNLIDHWFSRWPNAEQATRHHLNQQQSISTMYICGIRERWVNISRLYDAYMCQKKTLQWRHNEHDDVSNHQSRHYLLIRLFKAQIKENIKAPHHWPLYGDFTGDRWIPHTKGQ